MLTFTTFIKEDDDSLNVKVGQKVKLTHHFGGREKDRGIHTVTKVGPKHFEIDRVDSVTNKPMKFKHNGYSTDWKKSKSGRVKGMSISSGHRASLVD